jgi:hypothetical protein
VAHRVAEPSKILCNGCYGLLLSKGDNPEPYADGLHAGR